MENTENERMNYEAASRHLGITRGALRALVSRKRVPHLRLGARSVVFDRRELDQWLDSKRVTP
jgi:excisionase family DNA binding protein